MQAGSTANLPNTANFNPAATSEASQKGVEWVGKWGVGGAAPFCDVLLVAAGLDLFNFGKLPRFLVPRV